jgi:hypothetical protein
LEYSLVILKEVGVMGLNLGFDSSALGLYNLGNTAPDEFAKGGFKGFV